jgi:hypothetical protein
MKNNVKAITTIGIVVVLIWAAFWVGVIYVAWHFIAKFW